MASQRAKRLIGPELLAAVAELPKWHLVDDVLVRELKFDDFPAAIRFVNRLAEMAEAADHHPDIDIRYNNLRLGLITHDADGITAKDIAMARHIDQAFGR